MSWLDWAVLTVTILGIVSYGAWTTRGNKNIDTYLRGGNTLRWPTIGLSIMATQASAITFLSTPGQAYDDGMRFVQFYFGLPLAMIVISAVFVPIYFRLKVYTAYEYLEHRFDSRVRYLGAILFLMGRGLASGITLYAPSIILSTILGWSIEPLIIGMGLLVILYTVSGGTQAVSVTQKQQMIVMMAGLAIAAFVVIWKLPDDVSLVSAVDLAGALGRMNVVSFDFDINSRYNFWSGVTGGFFLALSYFGTDQSQVQRYLSGKSITEIRLGLLFNGMFKIPMQFVILSIGVLVFVFFLFTRPPVFFNTAALEKAAMSTTHAPELRALEARYEAAFETQRAAAKSFVHARGTPEAAAARAALTQAAAETTGIRNETRELITLAVPGTSVKDADYVFMNFVIHYLPVGLVGLLVAVILCAAMSSTASELSALGSTTTIDLYKRIWHGRQIDDPARMGGHDLLVSKLFTGLWGAFAIGFALYAAVVENLIEAVNIMGSVFYGTILGLFLVAFFLKRVTATPVFIAALIAEATVVGLFFASDLGFLWFNVIGCGIVVGLSVIFERLRRQ